MAKGSMEFENKEDAIGFIIYTMMDFDISIEDIEKVGIV